MPFRILVVDDDFDNRIIASEILMAAGHTVYNATNGIEGISTAQKEKPDIIFLDLSMPKLNGWEAAAKLKTMPDLSKIPIIAFTAHAMVGDEKKAIDAGCNDYLTKPCTPSKILEKVKKWGGQTQ